MADTEISDLTAVSAVAGTNEFAVNDAATSKKASATQLAGFIDVAASDTVAGKIEIAVQAEMEAGSDNTKAVTPGRQQFHPSAAKFWAYAGIAADLDASYNMTSLTDGGVGILGGTIAVDFSTTTWVGLVSVLDGVTRWNDANTTGCGFTAQAVGTFECRQATIQDGGTAACTMTDPTQWSVVGFGDQ